MPAKKNIYYVEVSDILEPEQEESVIEIVKGHLNKDTETLKEYFEKTDTIEIKRLTEAEAKNLSERLKDIEDISIRVYDWNEKIEEKKSSVVKCPKCGFILEYPEWRCPECYYEFPEYDFAADDEEEDTDDEETADDEEEDTDDEETAGDEEEDTDDEETTGDEEDTDDEETTDDEEDTG